MDEFESVLLVKNSVNIYKIPSISGNLKYRAADWNLENPDWTGRLKLIRLGNKCSLKFEDSEGKLFALCPVDKYPGKCIEGVSDSSRYFVVKLLNDDGCSAFVGLGFLDRADSFDLNVSLQDHFRWIKGSSEIEKKFDIMTNEPPINLQLKDGETFKLNLTTSRSKESPKNKVKPSCFVKLPNAELKPLKSDRALIESNNSKLLSPWETF